MLTPCRCSSKAWNAYGVSWSAPPHTFTSFSYLLFIQCNINETIVLEASQYLVKLGLKVCAQPRFFHLHLTLIRTSAITVSTSMTVMQRRSVVPQEISCLVCLLSFLFRLSQILISPQMQPAFPQGWSTSLTRSTRSVCTCLFIPMPRLFFATAHHQFPFQAVPGL